MRSSMNYSIREAFDDESGAEPNYATGSETWKIAIYYVLRAWRKI